MSDFRAVWNRYPATTAFLAIMVLVYLLFLVQSF